MATRTAKKTTARKPAKKTARRTATKKTTARQPRKRATKKTASLREQFEDTAITIANVCVLKKGTTWEQANEVAASLGKTKAHVVSVDGAFRILSEPRAKATPPAAKRSNRQPAKVEPKERKMSALNAAAKVLAEAGRALHVKAIIEAMAVKGYWSSPTGKTPDATLNAAIIREIATKGNASRFAKAAPGTYEFRGQNIEE